MTEGKTATTEGTATTTMSKAEVEFWEAGIQLRRDTRKEFADRQPDYGDVWMDLDLDTLCGTVRAEANRIRGEMTKEKLRHRVVDLNAYLTMLYRLIDDAE